MHICQYNIPTLVQVRRQAIVWTNAAMLSIRLQGTYFNEILSKIQKFPFKAIHLEHVVWEMAAILSRPQSFNIPIARTLGQNVSILDPIECLNIKMLS